MDDQQRQREQVLAEVDRLTPRLVETLADAIRVPSVNPKYPGQDYNAVVGAEGDVSQLMADLYREAGASVEMVAVERGRANACGRVTGSGGGRSLLLNGHVDVVPTGREDRWALPAFSGQVTDDAVHGRGATDMKSGTVASGFAAIALAAAGVRLRGDLVLQAVVGEEVGDHECGTTAALDAGYRADAAIVCEPTNVGTGLPKIAPVTPGVLWFSVTLEGKAAHASLRGRTIHPTLEGESLGVNTVDKFWPVYRALRDLEDVWAARDRHPHFPAGYFSLLPGVVQASPTGILVPFFLADSLVAEYCVTHHPDRPNEEVQQEIEKVITAACSNDPWLQAHPPVVEWKMLWPPYTVPTGHPLVATVATAHAAVTGSTGAPVMAEQEGFFGVCDITWMQRQGIDGVMYGPGTAATAHAVDEYVPIDQVVTAVKTYALAAMDYCGVEQGGVEEGSPAP